MNDTKSYYRDYWGDVWVRITQDYVRRIRDGNIGRWRNGVGLTKYEK